MFIETEYSIFKMNEKETVGLNITDFPEEVIVEDGISFYGETSYENQVAVMSHYLHNSYHEISDDKRKEIVMAIREFLSRKGYKQGVLDDMSDDEVWKVAESPHQNDLFADFFDIPFPTPRIPNIHSLTFLPELAASAYLLTRWVTNVYSAANGMPRPARHISPTLAPCHSEISQRFPPNAFPNMTYCLPVFHAKRSLSLERCSDLPTHAARCSSR